MSEIPSHLKYEPENHLWVDTLEDKDGQEVAYIGITDYAQDKMGELLFVELPDLESTYSKGDFFSSIESGKKDQDLNAPFEMEILEINFDLDDMPELVNSEPYQNWLCKVKIINNNELDDLMDADSYAEMIEE